MISYIEERNECRSGRDLILRDWVVTNLTNSVRRRVILYISIDSGNWMKRWEKERHT
jgi:hypothetical protein